MSRPLKPLLSSDAILDTAIEILATKGESGLTIRGIAKAMKVNPNSIYHYFGNLDELLDATVKRIFQDLEVSCVNKDWREYLMDTALAYHALFLGHSNAIMLILSRKHQSQAYEVSGHTMELMEAAGFSLAEAIIVHEQIVSMVIGFCLLELSDDKTEDASVREKYPKNYQAREEAAQWGPERQLSFAVTSLINGLDALLASRAVTR